MIRVRLTCGVWDREQNGHCQREATAFAIFRGDRGVVLHVPACAWHSQAHDRIALDRFTRGEEAH